MGFPLPPDIRRATIEDVPAMRKLVNDAYRELADMGLNFTGTYQDEQITIERMQGAEVYLLHRGNELVASINISIKELENGTDRCVFIHQLAVRPDQKRKGIGSYLMNLAERRAIHEGISRLQLDTAIPATHLVKLYEGRGFKPIEEVQWEGKTYKSYIMEKRLGLNAFAIRDAIEADVPALTTLAIQLGYPNTTDEIASRLKKVRIAGDRLLVAVSKEGIPIAFEHLRVAQSFVAPDSVEIAALVVDENIRGGGVGRALVKAAEEWACSLKMKMIQLRS
ncbi:MAG: GNAT family N-acetyltransferase, partial [Proteobacteria bacterium]|nr:GNAT family N-acetyltransferase [Pseudomonadota bacterium]